MVSASGEEESEECPRDDSGGNDPHSEAIRDPALESIEQIDREVTGLHGDLETWVNEHHEELAQRAHHWAASLGLGTADADDALQETYMRALHLQTEKANDWSIRLAVVILKGKLIDAARRVQRRREVELLLEQPLEPAHHDTNSPSLADLEPALRDLCERCGLTTYEQEVLIRRLIHEEEFETIAHDLDRSEDSIRQALMRGRRKLQNGRGHFDLGGNE